MIRISIPSGIGFVIAMLTGGSMNIVALRFGKVTNTQETREPDGIGCLHAVKWRPYVGRCVPYDEIEGENALRFGKFSKVISD